MVAVCQRGEGPSGREHGPSGGDDVEAEAEGDGDLGGVERDEAHAAGAAVRRRRGGWRSARRSGCSRASAAARSRQRWSTGTTWRWSHVQAHGVLEVDAQDGSSVSRRSPAAPRSRASADADHTGSSSSAVERRSPARAPSTASASSATVSRATVIGPRSSPQEPGRGARPRPHRRPAVGGRQVRVARGASTARRRGEQRGRASRDVGGVERPELGGRPSGDGDDGALARGGPADGGGQVGAQLADTERGRGCVYTRVHKQTCDGARASRPALGAMNFAFTEEQEELRKTVRAFLDAKSPETGRARADGDRERLRRGRVVADGRADGPPGPAHPRGVRRLGLQLRRARHRARGDGPRAALRPVLLHRRARRQHAAAERRRRAPRRPTCRASPAARRSPRSPSPSRRASGTSPASRSRPPAERRRLDAHRHEDVRARRPHRRPDHRRRPHAGKGVSLFAVDGDAAGPHPHAAVDDGPDPQAGQARASPARRRR